MALADATTGTPGSSTNIPTPPTNATGLVYIDYTDDTMTDVSCNGKSAITVNKEATIWIMEDYEQSETMTIAANVTINGNGKTVTVTNPNAAFTTNNDAVAVMSNVVITRTNCMPTPAIDNLIQVEKTKLTCNSVRIFDKLLGGFAIYMVFTDNTVDVYLATKTAKVTLKTGFDTDITVWSGVALGNNEKRPITTNDATLDMTEYVTAESPNAVSFDKVNGVLYLWSHEHSFTDTPANYGVKGTRHKECTVCERVLETAEIPALPYPDYDYTPPSVDVPVSNDENKVNVSATVSGKDMDIRKGYEAYITVNGQRISDFKGGNVEITVPYAVPAGESVAGFSVWYIDEQDNPEKLKSTYDGKNKWFVVTHFSDYVIVYDENDANVSNCPKDETCPIHDFTDTDKQAWYHDGVHYCIDNGLMVGLGNNMFAPNGTTTRAQIVTILWRMEGEPLVEVAEGFKDVFEGEETNILSYEDVFDVSDWAMEAMQWACGSGIIQGIEKNNTMYLDPQGSAVRSQSAMMFYRFCTK